MALQSVQSATPPHSLEAERALLGSILLDNSYMPYAIQLMTRESFYSDAHATIFSAMKELYGKQSSIDPVTILEPLRREEMLERAGGIVYLASLTDGVPMGVESAFKEYCRIVAETAKQRKLLNVSNNLIARIMAGNNSAEDLLAFAHDTIQGMRLQESSVTDAATGQSQVAFKVEPPESDKAKKKKPLKSEDTYPHIPEACWHPLALGYRLAHEGCTEGSDNWHFITFYTCVGVMLGRSVGTRMGGLIFGNLYSVLIGQIGGDGKDTVADYGTDLIERVDPTVHIPEAIDSKAGFIKTWEKFNQRQQQFQNLRALLRLPEVRSYLDTAEQTGTKSIAPMLLTHYSPRLSLDNSSVQTDAHVPNPHLAMLACGARRFIQAIPESDLINGLGRRVCFVPGDPKGPKDDPDPPNLEILIPLASKLKEVLEFYRGRKNCLLRLSPGARKLWTSWYQTYWKRKRGDDLLAALNNGDRVTCRKIALINAGLDMSEEFISEDNLRKAMAFVEFLYECRWPIFSEHGSNPFMEIEKKILAKLPDPPGRVRKRWLQQQLAIDSKTFNDRLKWLSMPDGPLLMNQEGRGVWVWKRED